MHPGCIGEWLCETPVINFYLATRIHIRILLFLFFIPLVLPHRPGTRNRPVGLAQGVDRRRGLIGGGRVEVSATRASERPVKRGASPSRTSFPDEIKTLALVVGKMWPPRAQVGGSDGWKSRGGKSLVETAPKTDVSCVARRKRRVSRTGRLFF